MSCALSRSSVPPLLARWWEHLVRAIAWWVAVRTDDPIQAINGRNLAVLLTMGIVMAPVAAAIGVVAQDPPLLIAENLALGVISAAMWVVNRRGSAVAAWAFILPVALVQPTFISDTDVVNYTFPMTAVIPVAMGAMFIGMHGAAAASLVYVLSALVNVLRLAGVETEGMLAWLGLMGIIQVGAVVVLGLPAWALQQAIRAQVAANAALARMNAELEQRVAARTAELAESNAHLQESNGRLHALMRRREKELLAAAHDLNNQIGAIQAVLDLTLMDAEDAGVPAETVAASRARAEYALRVVDGLANDFRTAALLENDALTLDRRAANLSALVAALVAYLAPNAQRTGCAVVLAADAGDVVASVDVFRLERVLLNLIGNAVKYTMRYRAEHGGAGHVAVAVQRVPDGVVLRVVDNGPGLDAAALEVLGRPFTRLDTSQGTDGMGIGVYLARGIVRAHGGTLTYRSDGVGCGTAAEVWLPHVEEEPDGAR